jgi:hypothetical protein
MLLVWLILAESKSRLNTNNGEKTNGKRFTSLCKSKSRMLLVWLILAESKSRLNTNNGERRVRLIDGFINI